LFKIEPKIDVILNLFQNHLDLVFGKTWTWTSRSIGTGWCL